MIKRKLWRNIIMNNKGLKGIALILFGILLCVCSAEINGTILYSFSEFPFALIGMICGIAGLVLIFQKDTSDKDK